MLEEKGSKDNNFISRQVEDLIETFEYGNYVYLYYSFLEKFHVEPKSWSDLFEFLQYTKVGTNINKYLQNFEGGK